MSNSRIEKFFQKIQETNKRLDELYLQRRQINENLTQFHSKADELNVSKCMYYTQISSINKELANFFKRVKSLSEWANNSDRSESKAIASKNIIVLEQNISTLKVKRAAYEKKMASVQTELDAIYQTITELNIQKGNCNTEIRTLKQKKDEYKRSINGLKYGKKRC